MDTVSRDADSEAMRIAKGTLEIHLKRVQFLKPNGNESDNLNLGIEDFGYAIPGRVSYETSIDKVRSVDRTDKTRNNSQMWQMYCMYRGAKTAAMRPHMWQETTAESAQLYAQITSEELWECDKSGTAEISQPLKRNQANKCYKINICR